MKKEFYIGQPLIIKETGKKVNLINNDKAEYKPYLAIGHDERRGSGYDYYNHHELEPSTEFKFSEIITGLEQGYFEVGAEFRMSGTDRVITVQQGIDGLYLERLREHFFLTSKHINSTWILVEPRKEMTLEEIEAELGYKIKLKDNGGN